MKKLLIFPAALALGIVLAMCEGATNKSDSVKAEVRDLCQDCFDAGAKIGYMCAAKGGTKADLEMLVNAKRSNDIATVTRWFNTH